MERRLVPDFVTDDVSDDFDDMFAVEFSGVVTLLASKNNKCQTTNVSDVIHFRSDVRCLDVILSRCQLLEVILLSYFHTNTTSGTM